MLTDSDIIIEADEETYGENLHFLKENMKILSDFLYMKRCKWVNLRHPIARHLFMKLFQYVNRRCCEILIGILASDTNGCLDVD